MKTILKNEKGQGLVEYLTLVFLITIASLGVTQTLGKQIKNKIIEARSQIDSKLTVE